MENPTVSLENLDELLLWLDPDPEKTGIPDINRGAAKHEAIRQRITKIYRNRGCQQAEEIADEAILRVCRKVKSLRETYKGDPALYLYGVAKNVYREFSRVVTNSLAEDRITYLRPPAPPPPPDEALESERRMACLDECLDELEPEESGLIKRFYEGEKGEKIKNRRAQAKELGITAKALSLRAFRIRRQLRECVRKCLGLIGAPEVDSGDTR